VNRHPLRWENLIFGLVFLGAVGHWAVWRTDLLTTRELSLTASGVLIFLGVVGIAATLWKARAVPVQSPTMTNEGVLHEEADPQS
jgi:hypothetical protein